LKKGATAGRAWRLSPSSNSIQPFHAERESSARSTLAYSRGCPGPMLGISVCGQRIQASSHVGVARSTVVSSSASP
jgi:hypothetical protein